MFWMSKKKMGDFFNSTLNMLEVSNKDLIILQEAVLNLGKAVTSIQKLVQIQEERISLLELKRGEYIDDKE
jgi:hypothetical protein